MRDHRFAKTRAIEALSIGTLNVRTVAVAGCLVLAGCAGSSGTGVITANAVGDKGIAPQSAASRTIASIVIDRALGKRQTIGVE